MLELCISSVSKANPHVPITFTPHKFVLPVPAASYAVDYAGASGAFGASQWTRPHYDVLSSTRVAQADPFTPASGRGAASAGCRRFPSGGGAAAARRVGPPARI